MTAIVVRGLTRAIRHVEGRSEVAAVRDRAAQALVGMLGRNASPDPPTFASAVLALAEAGKVPGPLLGKALRGAREEVVPPVFRAWALRAGIAAGAPRESWWPVALRLAREAVREGSGAHWRALGAGEEGGFPTRWQEDDVETTAEALHALLLAGIESDRELLDAGAHWLLERRAGGEHWGNTRSTAAAVSFLAAHAVRTGDLGLGSRADVLLGGEPLGTVAITKESLVSSNAVLDVPKKRLRPGEDLVFEIRTEKGRGRAALSLAWFETGPAIAASEAGFRVTRRWFRLEPPGAGGGAWRRNEVTETVATGALLECEVRVETERDRDYVMVVDPHVGGFEPERGTATTVEGRDAATPSHVERYDDRTAFFVPRLRAGTHVFRHVVRATHVGNYTALPAEASLMYFPMVRGTSAGETLEVSEAAPAGTRPEGGR
jgi:hypothetical protein